MSTAIHPQTPSLAPSREDTNVASLPYDKAIDRHQSGVNPAPHTDPFFRGLDASIAAMQATHPLSCPHCPSCDGTGHWRGCPNQRNRSDPFFRVLDETLATEARIRMRANEMLWLIVRGDGWQIGSPDAQLGAMERAHREIQESLDREYAECVRRPGP